MHKSLRWRENEDYPCFVFSFLYIEKRIFRNTSSIHTFNQAFSKQIFQRKYLKSRALSFFFYEGRKETKTPFVLLKDRRAIVETRKDVSRKPGHQPVRGLARCLRDAPLSRSLSLAEAAVIRVNGRRRRKPATTTDLSAETLHPFGGGGGAGGWLIAFPTKLERNQWVTRESWEADDRLSSNKGPNDWPWMGEECAGEE